MSNLISKRTNHHVRTIVYGFIVLCIITATVFSFPEKEESPRLRRLISLFGLFVFIFGTFASSVVSISFRNEFRKYALTQFSIVNMCNGIQLSLLF